MVELSIVVPTYNRARLLRACLAALAAQTAAPGDFEVIVVVDGSTDGTLAMLQQVQTPYRLVVDVRPNGGAARARNQGAALARGRACLFLDDDILAEPQLVAEHLRAQRQAETPVVGLGQIVYGVPPHADGFARQVAAWWQDHYAALERGAAPGPLDCWSGNLSVPVAAFRAVGGFDPAAEQSHDVDLGYRLVAAGLRLAYLPGAVGHQAHSKPFRLLAHDAEQAGRANVRLLERYPSLLPQLALGRAAEARLRFQLLRRLLLALDPPLGLLHLASLVVGRGRLANAWYGLVFDLCYWRGVRAACANGETWRRLQHAPPVLLYHAFGRPGEPASRFVVPIRRFARQLRLLRCLGYTVLSLDQLLDARRSHRLPPARSLAITIDDGYADALELARPVLDRMHVPATLFAVSGALGGTNSWDRSGPLAGRRLLDWSGLRQLASSHGISIGAHTRTHARLTELEPAALASEVAGARSDLEQALGRPVVAFAYPYGAVDDAAAAAVGQAGYLAGCGIEAGGNSPARPDVALRRTEVWGTDSLLRFALAVCLGDSLGDRRWIGRHGGR